MGEGKDCGFHFFSSGVEWGCGFEIESLCSLAVQELTIQTRLTLNSCLCLWGDGIKDVYHHLLALAIIFFILILSLCYLMPEPRLLGASHTPRPKTVSLVRCTEGPATESGAEFTLLPGMEAGRHPFGL